MSLFRPKRIVPNTLDPRLRGLDWLCIDRMFEDCLQVLVTRPVEKIAPLDFDSLQEDEDVAIKNLMGGGDVADMARLWAGSDSIRRRLEVAREYLRPLERVVVDRFLGVCLPLGSSSAFTSACKGKQKALAGFRYGSDEDTEDDDDDGDERGRTAHQLFASLAGIDEKATSWWLSSPVSDGDEQDLQMARDSLTPLKRISPFKQQFSGAQPLTPVSSPFRRTEKVVTRQERQFTTSTPTHHSTKSPKRLNPRQNNHTLASPILLHSYSSQHSSPFMSKPKLKSKVPGTYCHPKSPLMERKNRMSEATTTSSIPNSSPPLCTVRPVNVVPQLSPSPRSSPLVNVDRGPRSPNSKVPSQESASCRSPHFHRSRRLQNYLQRIKIGERLAQSRPSSVVPSYKAKRAKLIARYVKLEAKESYARAMAKLGRRGEADILRGGSIVPAFDDVGDDDDDAFDWNRSRDLADSVRMAIANGQPVVLPPLKCADSQSSEYAF